MLTAKIFLVTVVLVMSFASEETNYSRLLRVLRLSDHRSFDTRKRRGDEINYFEQCSFVSMWKGQLGHVSVLAFLDPAWQYSFRQAVMLELLSLRLRKSSFPDIRFFVIAPPPDLMEDKTEDDYEIEVWRKITATYETEESVNTNLFFKDSEPKIIFIQDDPQFRIWERFRASKNQVVVIDRCGQLTYQVMVPWSILYFPYVKAAILSTHQEDPCGGCDPTMYQDPEYEEYSSNLRSTTKGTDPHEIDKINAELIWTTERSSGSVHFEESLKEEHETNIVLPVISDKITHDSDDLPNFSNMTESSVMSETTYRYDNGTTAFSPNENNPNETRRREDLKNATASDVTEELQQDVPSRRDESTLSDNSIRGNASHRGLSSNESTSEIKNEFIFTTTISETAGDDEIRDNDEDADSLIDENEENDSIGKHIGETEESTLALHVIMRAPHVHRNGRNTEKHTHLILKIGNPDFHGHLDNFKDMDLQVASSEKNDSKAIEANQENADRTYVFDQDESPGLYGEIADYWREDNDDTNKNESPNSAAYSDSTISYNEKHHINISGDATTPSKSSEIDENYSTASITINAYINNSTNSQNTVRLDKIDSSINTSNEINKKEETRSNVIKHYNKLLNWIDYRLKMR